MLLLLLSKLAHTNANFEAAIVEWFAGYFDPTAYHDQKEYLLGATKAYSMTVKETATRVEEYHSLHALHAWCSCSWYSPVYSDVEKKMVLYRLMRNNWKTNFDASGNDITDAGYTWNNLVTYMTAQRRKKTATQDKWLLVVIRMVAVVSVVVVDALDVDVAIQAMESMRRAADYQGGRPSVRFRPNNYGYGGQGYLPPPYGRGYPQGLARGYDYGGHGYAGGHSG